MKKYLCLLVFSVLVLSGCGLSQSSDLSKFDIVFKKSALKFDLSSKQSFICKIKISQSVSSKPDYEGSNPNYDRAGEESFSISTSKDPEAMILTFNGIGTDNPQIIGNAGESDLAILGKDLLGENLTFVEKGPAQLGTASVYNFSPKEGTVVWTKNYGGYAHVGVGYCE